jgi:hypothetical protein
MTSRVFLMVTTVVVALALLTAQTNVKLQTSQTESVPVATTAVGASAVTILAANANRRQFSVVNTGTTIIYVSLGSTTPTTTVYHYPLKGCAVAHDATGGFVVSDMWRGDVKAIGSGAGGQVSVTEIRGQ